MNSLRYSCILEVLIVHKTYAHFLEYDENKSFIFILFIDQNMAESKVLF